MFPDLRPRKDFKGQPKDQSLLSNANLRTGVDVVALGVDLIRVFQRVGGGATGLRRSDCTDPRSQNRLLEHSRHLCAAREQTDFENRVLSLLGKAGATHV